MSICKMYEHFLRPILFRTEPEKAHQLAGKAIRFFGQARGIHAITKRLYSFQDPRLVVRFGNLRFPNPIGMAAGFDKNCLLYQALPSFGFGFVEVGTITREPWSGNQPPRIFRHPESLALVNRLGFPNPGVKVCADRLKTGRKAGVLGINIGKTSDVPLREAADDLSESYRRLFPLLDYAVINVSSPNTPGTRNLQDKIYLENIIQKLIRVRSELSPHYKKPLFIKISPDISEKECGELLETVSTSDADGLIVTNTSSNHSYSEQGGMSGKPLADMALSTLRWFTKRAPRHLTFIASGGIFSAEDAFDRITAGASLVQIYTSWIYKGPGLVKNLNLGILKIMKERGFVRLQDAIGSNV